MGASSPGGVGFENAGRWAKLSSWEIRLDVLKHGRQPGFIAPKSVAKTCQIFVTEGLAEIGTRYMFPFRMEAGYCAA